MVKRGTYEDRISRAVARVPRRAGSLPALRRTHRFGAGRSAFASGTPRTCVPEKGRSEPEPARPEAKGHVFRFFGPRGRVLDCRRRRFCFSDLASEFLVGNALTHDPRYGEVEAVPVVHLAAVVIAEHLHPDSGTGGKVPRSRRRSEEH